MRSLAIAVSFLTRIPVPVVVRDEREVAGSAPWFPVVGLLLGVATTAVYLTAVALFPLSIAAVLTIVGGTALTGAFHEDGLVDTFDGLAGAVTADRRIEIMKDSRLGTFGTVALVSALALQVLSVASIESAAVPAVLVAAHVLSRTVALMVMASSRPAADRGLGAAFLSHLDRPGVSLGVIAGVVIGVSVLATASSSFVLGVLSASAAGFAVRWWAYRRIGGVTGDVLGAAQQAAFVVVLLFGAVVGGPV